MRPGTAINQQKSGTRIIQSQPSRNVLPTTAYWIRSGENTMDQGSIWYTADAHFGADSNDIIKREMRPFLDVVEYTQQQISIWNDQLSQNDLIYFLGDFCNYNFKETDYKSGLAVSKHINAHIILLIGNSEERVIHTHFDGNFHRFREYCLNNYNFDDVRINEYTTICGQKFFLTHKPTNHDKQCLNRAIIILSVSLWRNYQWHKQNIMTPHKAILF